MTKSAANAANAELQLTYAKEALSQTIDFLQTALGHAVVDDPTDEAGDQGRIRDLQGAVSLVLAGTLKEQNRWSARATARYAKDLRTDGGREMSLIEKIFYPVGSPKWWEKNTAELLALLDPTERQNYDDNLMGSEISSASFATIIDLEGKMIIRWLDKRYPRF